MYWKVWKGRKLKLFLRGRRFLKGRKLDADEIWQRQKIGGSILISTCLRRFWLESIFLQCNLVVGLFLFKWKVFFSTPYFSTKNFWLPDIFLIFQTPNNFSRFKRVTNIYPHTGSGKTFTELWLVPVGFTTVFWLFFTTGS